MAWIGDGANYHTRRDSLNNMRRGSLQHTGNAILRLLQPLLRITAAEDIGTAPEPQEIPELPFYQDVLGRAMLVIPGGAFTPLAALAMLLFLLDYTLQRRVLGVQTSQALVYLSCLTFALSCLAAAVSACCWSIIGALILQRYGPLYVHWPTAAAWRVAVASAALIWCWDKAFFRKYAQPTLQAPLIAYTWPPSCFPPVSHLSSRRLHLISLFVMSFCGTFPCRIYRLNRRFPFNGHPLLCLHAARAGPLLIILLLGVALRSQCRALLFCSACCISPSLLAVSSNSNDVLCLVCLYFCRLSFRSTGWKSVLVAGNSLREACCGGARGGSGLSSAFYVILLSLGLLGPRVTLLLFWSFRSAKDTLSGSRNEGENNDKSKIFFLRIRRGCALQIVDAVGAVLPSVLFFQVSLKSRSLTHVAA